jgi:hypothetical protein
MLPFVLNSCEIDRSLREMAYLLVLSIVLDDHSTSYKLMLVVARVRSAYVAAIVFRYTPLSVFRYTPLSVTLPPLQ